MMPITAHARRAAALVLAGVALLACRDRPARSDAPDAGPAVTVVGRVATLYVERGGEVYMDRERITLDALRDSLEALRGRPGVSLWYARARPDSAPTPAQAAVLQEVMDARISVRLVEPGAPEIGQMMPAGARP